MTIQNFSDFCSALTACGFSMGGGNAKGIFTVIPRGWEEGPQDGSPIRWHTGDPETDPWEWRMRVLRERDDIAYSKLFFGTSGYIAKEWYPLFFAVRRRGGSFEEAYKNGVISQTAKRIYDIISENGETALHDLKRIGCFGREESSGFERAVLALQTGMFITMSGQAQKLNRYGESYGWSSTVFTTVEDFWEKRGVSLQSSDPDAAYEKIKTRTEELNPGVDRRITDKFIKG